MPLARPAQIAVLSGAIAGRGAAAVLRALEAGPVEVVAREEEVLRARLAVDAQAARLRLADRARARRVRHVDDQDRHVDQLRQRDRPLDRLALCHARMGDRVVARRRRAGVDEAFRQPGDHAVVLGVNHREGAEPPRGGQDVQELLVLEAESLVGHVDLERRDAFCDQPGQVLAEGLLGRIGDDQVERVVDHRLLAGAAVVVLDDGPELHPAVLRGERDHGRGAAEGRGHGARWKSSAQTTPAEESCSMWTWLSMPPGRT